MTTEVRDNLVAWLRDAHSMEEQSEKMLTALTKRLKNYPELKDRIDQHIEETRHQTQIVSTCLERLGSDTSTMKDTAAKMLAMAQGMSGMFVSDEVIKATLATYAFEHMEIASYKAIIAAAEMHGDVEIQLACEQILVQEQEMADWLSKHLPIITHKFLARDETAGIKAKH